MTPRLLSSLAALLPVLLSGQNGPPPLRNHQATQAQPLQRVPATEDPPAASQASFTASDNRLAVSSNAIPDHRVGRFPNSGNPHTIRPQHLLFSLPFQPQPAPVITPLHAAPSSSRSAPPNQPFGIALNGVLFDPGTAEFWKGDRAAGWNYEALGGAVALGLDAHHGHVQPSGAYHYHGLPQAVLDALQLKPDQHAPLVGWAADGFPIYALRGHTVPHDPSSPVKTLRSSYSLRKGQRPGPPIGPGGDYDGAFVQDYEFVSGSGDLDECNGRFGVTPEFPEGTYAYFLTAEWPVIPRAFRGSPVNLRTARGGPRQDPR